MKGREFTEQEWQHALRGQALGEAIASSIAPEASDTGNWQGELGRNLLSQMEEKDPNAFPLQFAPLNPAPIRRTWAQPPPQSPMQDAMMRVVF